MPTNRQKLPRPNFLNFSDIFSYFYYSFTFLPICQKNVLNFTRFIVSLANFIRYTKSTMPLLTPTKRPLPHF